MRRLAWTHCWDWLASVFFQSPKGESVGSITQPLPSNYLIFRAASESDGEHWRLSSVKLSSLYGVNLRITACGLLQDAVGWMLWSWLSAASACRRWRRRAAGMEIWAAPPSPHTYCSCCRARLSPTRTCCSESDLSTSTHRWACSHQIQDINIFVHIFWHQNCLH